MCKIDGCERDTRGGHGMCKFHYQRWLRTGDALKVRKPPNGEARRFFETVVLSHRGDDCLTWPYFRDEHGYGRMAYKGRTSYVHRVALEIQCGEAPAPDSEASHTCGNGRDGCCNPKHLKWESRSENLMRRVDHGTDNRGERHPMSKLTEQDISAIRALRGKETMRETAKRFGVTSGHVSEIQNGSSWSWAR